MHRENVHEIQPEKYLFSVLNVSWSLSIQDCVSSSEVDNPVRKLLYRYLCCLDLKWLLRLRGSYQRSLNNDGCSNVQLGNLCEILHVIVIYDLKSFKKLPS